MSKEQAQQETGPFNPFNLADYQILAGRTLPDMPLEPDASDRFLLQLTLSLCGEAGELANIIKKIVGHGHPINTSAIKGELGDCMWYVAALATYFGLRLDVIGEENLAKLRRRYPGGFSEHASIHREE